MSVGHKHVDVRISRRTLWVGSQAYPLQQVTRVEPLEFKLNHRKVVVRHVRKIAAWSGLGLFGLLFLGCLGNSVPTAGYAVLVAVVLGMVTWYAVRLVRRLLLPPLYALSVATSGAPRAAVVSTDRDLVYDLTRRVVDAIDNPAIEYAIRVDHIEAVFGDKIFGDKVDGDKVDGNKVIFGN